MDITNRAGAEQSQDRSIIADSLSDERESRGRRSADELRPESYDLRVALKARGIGAWEWELATGRMKWSA
jgi:hypothetical protein